MEWESPERGLDSNGHLKDRGWVQHWEFQH